MPFPATDIGDGLVLTQLDPADAEELFALVDQNREYLRPWMRWADATESVSDILDFVERSRRQDTDGLGFQCSVRLDGKLVAVVGHVAIQERDRETELGYWIDRDHQGRGIVTRSVRALVDHAFSELKLRRITIQAAEANVKSRAVAERLGFRLEGVLRQSGWAIDGYVNKVVYGLLEGDRVRPAGERG